LAGYLLESLGGRGVRIGYRERRPEELVERPGLELGGVEARGEGHDK
jgi:hypothetical protein